MQKTEYVIVLDQSASTFPQREWVAEQMHSLWEKLMQRSERTLIPFFLIHQQVAAWTLCVDPKEGKDFFPNLISSYGTTPLYDAICQAVNVVGRTGRFDPSAHTQLLIFTDGKDHGSVHTKEDADRALRYVREELGWEVIFRWPDRG